MKYNLAITEDGFWVADSFMLSVAKLSDVTRGGPKHVVGSSEGLVGRVMVLASGRRWVQIPGWFYSDTKLVCVSGEVDTEINSI